nr:MAG TPA: hypothetical protein [Caudoviricetes sp.]
MPRCASILFKNACCCSGVLFFIISCACFHACAACGFFRSRVLIAAIAGLIFISHFLLKLFKFCASDICGRFRHNRFFVNKRFKICRSRLHVKRFHIYFPMRNIRKNVDRRVKRNLRGNCFLFARYNASDNASLLHLLQALLIVNHRIIILHCILTSRNQCKIKKDGQPFD